MRIAIVGSRSITDPGFVRKIVEQALAPMKKAPLTILSGGAKGVDSIVQQWAQEMGKDFILFKPYHLLDKKVAYEPKYFFVRNKQMIDNADSVMVIWDGESNGSFDVIRYANKINKPLLVYSTKKGDFIDLSSIS